MVQFYYSRLYLAIETVFCRLLQPREDKGDREGIPHTHPIP